MPACAIEIICETHLESLPPDLEGWLTPKLVPMMEHLGRAGVVELVLVSSAQIAKLNQEFRNIPKSTDVLSFPIEMPAQQLLGSVVINIDLAIQESQARGHALLDEIALLFVHGYLHLLGYDHECDQGQQRALEQEIIAHFNLPLSLMARTECL
ncbi:rRNA maturation RNase YbeY [Helicobacter bizzozeronii]|uniref:rRNA maturation RNase YbeY n=1 Tax=Helicobacter bizzozeronii TaxID=56877 RepID=UPI000CF0E16E|nr:rRNA maturation RNase YbeY [Helicobacter bizzozeronii]